MTGSEIAFFAFALIAIASAIGMVTSRNVVAAAVWLVLSFIAVAANYILLHATFLAAIQVLVYAGAIMVLFVFVIMVLDVDESGEVQHRKPPPVSKWAFYSGFTATMGFFIWVLVGTWSRQVYPNVGADLSNRPEFGTAEAVGRELFGPYLFAFEAVSLTLLAAVIGAVVVARSRRERLADASPVDARTRAKAEAGDYPDPEFGKPSATGHQGGT